jgi:hypothetical protein
MPSANHFLRPDDKRRGVGLIYSDQSLLAGPATHVLIIGIGSYQSRRLKSAQTSTISARQLADWFVDGTKARFTNRNCKLGSVALLLSEDKQGARSSYAGGEVPRATFANAKAAVRSWLERINTHKNNLAILYVAGHGESFLNRTSFLLEDFGGDPLDATAGMVEVEQLIGSLENAKPVSQLLFFDCCRNPTAAELPWNEPPGNKLIALTRSLDDHGEPRKQWAICSTSLGNAATGLTAGPTLFNMALLESLNGVAGDTSTDGWPVRPGLLFDKINRILGLHRLPDEQPQTPAGRCAGSFDITFPGESPDIPAYITLSDPADWPGSTINLKVNGTEAAPIRGAAGQSPFHIRKVPEQATLEVEAKDSRASLGRVRTKVRAPAMFVTINKTPEPIVKRTPPNPSVPSALLIYIPSFFRFGNGAVVSIVWRDKPEKPAEEVAAHIGIETRVEVEPGELTVTLQMADGRVQSRDVTVDRHEVARVVFDIVSSPHEWLASAVIAGAIRRASYEPRTSRPRGEEVGFQFIRDSFDASAEDGRGPGMSLSQQIGDDRFVRINLEDRLPERYPAQFDHVPEHRPADVLAKLWANVSRRHELPPQPLARLTFAERSEVVPIPSIGGQARNGRGGWTPFVMIDRGAAHNEPMTTVVVEDQIWSGLLGFLASRDLIKGSVLLDRRTLSHAVMAIEDKVTNPLAAVAGALIAVAGSNPEQEQEWDRWLINIVKWFPTIPDGPIILARRLLMKARTPSQLKLATGFLIEGYLRGVPYYSLSVDWLARGMESIPTSNEVVIQVRNDARRIANRVDPTYAFTVIREL